jgi:hypothetical protein
LKEKKMKIIAYKQPTPQIMEPEEAERSARDYNRWLKKFRIYLTITTFSIWLISILIFGAEGFIAVLIGGFIPFLILWGHKEPELMELPEDRPKNR